MDVKKIKELKFDPFKLFDDQWALVTSGDFSNHNSMTIAWGELGTLWHRNVVTIYIKPCRYTYSFIENNDYFVVSFFASEYKHALAIMGNKSGRNVDKDKLANLTPIKHNDVTIYKEAKLTFVCKKIYFADLDLNSIPKIEIDKYYKEEKPHRMYVGEIIEIID